MIATLLAPMTAGRDLLLCGLPAAHFPEAASAREAEPTERLPIAAYDVIILADTLLALGDTLPARLSACRIALREGGTLYAAATGIVERTLLTDSLIPAVAAEGMRYRLSMHGSIWLLRVRDE